MGGGEWRGGMGGGDGWIAYLELVLPRLGRWRRIQEVDCEDLECGGVSGWAVGVKKVMLSPSFFSSGAGVYHLGGFVLVRF